MNAVKRTWHRKTQLGLFFAMCCAFGCEDTGPAPSQASARSSEEIDRSDAIPPASGEHPVRSAPSANGLQLVMWDSGDRGTWNQGIAFALWSDGVFAIAESFPRASADLRWGQIDPSARERILDSWFDVGQSCFAVQTLAPSAASASVRFTSAEGAKEQDFSYFKLHYPDEYLDECMKAIRAAVGVIERSCAGASELAPPEKEAEVASWNMRNRPRVSESK